MPEPITCLARGWWLVADENPLVDHQAGALESSEIGQRVALDDQHVGQHAGLEGAQ